jgi:hypothetical protein
MISPGKKLKTNFKLKVVQDGAESEVAFSELLTRRTIVSVYMKNNTGSCDKQNDSLAAQAAAFAKAGYNLVAELSLCAEADYDDGRAPLVPMRSSSSPRPSPSATSSTFKFSPPSWA